MSISRDQLAEFLDNYLNVKLFRDYGPNGLQVEGKSEIKSIVTGVTSNLALIEKAIELNADAVLVHHGLFWKGDSPCLVGSHGKRLSKLLLNQLNLFAYHLPLDAHPILGNNTQLAELLGLEQQGFLEDGMSPPIGVFGKFKQASIPIDQFVKTVHNTLNREPLWIDAGKKQVETIAWCTGAAQRSITAAIAAKVDVYLTGEVSEPTVHLARENNIHFISAGHHATERYGIQALGEMLNKEFGIKHVFVDIDNPV